MKAFLVLRSQTEAFRAKMLLERTGIYSQVEKITNQGSGCTFGLRLNHADYAAAQESLRGAGYGG